VWARGEVINGGFGMVIDGTDGTAEKIRMMLHWDVNNGIGTPVLARKQWRQGFFIKGMDRTPSMKVTVPFDASDEIIEEAFNE
jgi:urocanate hydratase